jgi:hypothetical protein
LHFANKEKLSQCQLLLYYFPSVLINLLRRRFTWSFAFRQFLMHKFLLVGLSVLSRVAAHGDHGGGGAGQKPMADENANWMTKHMAGKPF